MVAKSDRPPTNRPHHRLFAERVAALSAFVSEHNRLPRVEDDLTLYSWMGSQRAKKRAGKLTADQIAALEAVPLWWWTWADRQTASRSAVSVWRGPALMMG